MPPGHFLPDIRMPLPLLALAVASFGIGPTEFVIMGLLPDLARDLGVDIPSAGLLVSGYALSVTFGSPLLALATGRLPRKAALGRRGGFAHAPCSRRRPGQPGGKAESSRADWPAGEQPRKRLSDTASGAERDKVSPQPFRGDRRTPRPMHCGA